MRSKFKLIIFICISLALIFEMSAFSEVTSVNSLQANPQYEPVSKAKLIGLSAVSSFSPGIALLSIIYDVKKERNKNGENGWLVNWLWLYWIIAFLDVTLDKIPIWAHAHHFMQYGLVWYVAYVAANVLGADVSMLLGALTGTGVQAARQTYHVPVAAGTLTSGTPILSTIEDVLTGVVINMML